MTRAKLQKSNSVKVAALQMKKIKVPVGKICKDLDIDPATLWRWEKASKAAGKWKDAPGEIARPATRKKSPGTGPKSKISQETKDLMKAK